MDTQTRDQVYSIIKNTIRVDPATIDPAADLRKQVSLDSMQYVSLMARLEVEFDIELPITIMESKSLDEFLSILNHEIGMKKSSSPRSAN